MRFYTEIWNISLEFLSRARLERQNSLRGFVLFQTRHSAIRLVNITREIVDESKLHAGREKYGVCAIICKYLHSPCLAAKFHGKQRTRAVVYACVDIP